MLSKIYPEQPTASPGAQVLEITSSSTVSVECAQFDFER